jgi:hypothetical protein
MREPGDDTVRQGYFCARNRASEPSHSRAGGDYCLPECQDRPQGCPPPEPALSAPRVVATPWHATMASEVYVRLARRRKRGRLSKLRADTEALHGWAEEWLPRSFCRASWLFLKPIP